MKTSDHPELHELVESRLQRTAQRYTAGRRAVVEALMEIGNPATIEDLGRCCPDLPLSSLYRHLVALQAANVVTRVASNGSRYGRFEIEEHITGHHHHLVCSACGRVTAVVPSNTLKEFMNQHLEDMASSEGFLVRSHRIDIYGVCAECQKAPPRVQHR